MNNIVNIFSKDNIFEKIKSKNDNEIKSLLLNIINYYVDKYNEENTNKMELDECVESNILLVVINGDMGKRKYFRYSNKFEIIKKMLIYMFDEIKFILYNSWNKDYEPIINLEKIFLENLHISYTIIEVF